MLSRMCFGLVLVLITVLTKVIIFNFEDSQSDMAYAGKLLCFSNFARFIFYSCVCSITGVYSSSVSSTYEGSDGWIVVYFWGIGSLFNTITKFPFHCQSQYICTNFCY